VKSREGTRVPARLADRAVVAGMKGTVQPFRSKGPVGISGVAHGEDFSGLPERATHREAPRGRVRVDRAKGCGRPDEGGGHAGSGLTSAAPGQARSERLTFKPYWGKPDVRNFRGGGGDVGIMRSPVRATALPDPE